MKKFFCLISFIIPLLGFAQNSNKNEEPTWIKGFFSEHTNSYIETVAANGYTEDDARNKAAQQIIERRSLATGQQNNVKISNGEISIIGNDNLIVKSRIIDSFTEKFPSGEYRVSLLVQTAKNPDLQFEMVQVTDKYPFSPRVFIPGMAQLHKGQKIKGSLFITGELLCVGGIIVSESLRSSYESKIGRTHIATEKQNYINQADNWQNIRNCFIGATAAIYIWNVIDGIVAKGKKHILVGKNQLTFLPYTGMDSAGLYLSLTF